MADVPNSHKDPYWSQLASVTEDKVGIPKGLLQSILTRGERSNNDQVSDAGARTPFQIIPQTRKAAIDKWGIDPYLSPENAAEVAGLLLKDSIQRNKGNVAEAVGEYVGGTDRKNWGPVTKSYINRVMTGINTPSIAATLNQGTGTAQGGTQSTFDKVQAQMKAQAPQTPQIAAIYSAYQSGQMTPEEAADFEKDVKSGALMLPRGATLKADAGSSGGAPAAAAGAGGSEIPDAVFNAYRSGAMSTDERREFEADLKSGAIKLSPAQQNPATSANGIPLPNGTTFQPNVTPADPTLVQKAIGAGEAGLTAVTGGTTGALGMVGGTVGGLVGSVMSGDFGTPQGVKNVEQAAAAGADALTYAPRTASGQDQAHAVGQAMQQLIPVAPLAGEAAMMGRAGAPAVMATQDAIRAAPQAVADALGAGKPAAVAAPAEAGGAAVAAAAVPAIATEVVAPAAPALAAPELAQVAKKAADGGFGSRRAKEVLAGEAAPDPKVLEAAKRLGIDEYLQPDHVTTNQAYRELAQAVKSIPGSEARAAEMVGLEAVAKRADQLIDEIGGTSDLSTLDSSIKVRLNETQRNLDKKAESLYDQVRQAIPASTPVAAPKTVAFLTGLAEDMGGVAKMPSGERALLQSLKPADNAPLTYAFLDFKRKELGQAMRSGSGAFKDAESGLVKKLYRTLSEDQEAVAQAAGAGELFGAAKSAVRQRKAVEDDLAALFGRNLDKSFVGSLSSSVKALPAGDPSGFIKLLKAVPEDMRQDVVASGLNTAFGKNAKNGNLNFNSYANWYEGMLRNKQSHTALMSNLPPGARKQLSDLYRVSDGVRQATRERITTGRIQAVANDIQGADTLMANIYGLARRASVGLAAEAVTTPMGVPGAGLASGLTSALTKGKTNYLRAADALIASPEFANLVKNSDKPKAKKAAVAQLAHSAAFNKFMRAVGKPAEMKDRQQWLVNAMATSGQQPQQNKK
jgi:hypothetical protein